MELFTDVLLPFLTTILKYFFMCIGVFNHLSNDSYIFISSNIQTETISKDTTWNKVIKNLGNTFILLLKIIKM